MRGKVLFVARLFQIAMISAISVLLGHSAPISLELQKHEVVQIETVDNSPPDAAFRFGTAQAETRDVGGCPQFQ